jgi:hypothetical protein
VYLEQDKHIEVVGTTDMESGYILYQVGPESVMFSFIFGNIYHRTAADLYYLALKLGSLRRDEKAFKNKIPAEVFQTSWYGVSGESRKLRS